MDDNSVSCISSRSGTASPEDTVDTDKSITETPPMSDKKRKCNKKSRNDDIDELLVKSLASLQEKKPKIAEDEEGLFGKQVAATLRRFTLHQKAIAKLQIQQALTTIEFPVDTNFMSPYSTSATPY